MVSFLILGRIYEIKLHFLQHVGISIWILGQVSLVSASLVFFQPPPKFNACSESVGEKASFHRLLPGNRCLVVVEGFYEWKKDGAKKLPYYIHLKDDRPFIFAALYDSCKNSEGESHNTFTILTTSSSSALGWLHDRMPVILGNKGSIDEWLQGSPSSKLDSLLKPYEETLGLVPCDTCNGQAFF